MKEIQQKSPGNSESEAVPFAETLRETLKEGGADAQASEDWTRGGHDGAAVEGPTEAELETRGEKREGIPSSRRNGKAGKAGQAWIIEGLECRAWKPMSKSSDTQHMPIKHFCDDRDALTTIQHRCSARQDRHHL